MKGSILRSLEKFKFTIDILSNPDSSDQLFAHDQAISILDDVASRLVDRNDGAGIRSLFRRSVELYFVAELLQIQLASNAEDPEVKAAWLDFVNELDDEGSCPNKTKSVWVYPSFMFQENGINCVYGFIVKYLFRLHLTCEVRHSSSNN